jgi:hypothetical protein
MLQDLDLIWSSAFNRLTGTSTLRLIGQALCNVRTLRCGCRWRKRHIKMGVKWEAFTMSHGKRNSKQKGRTKAVTVLGVAGALSLAGGASGAAVGPPGDTLTANTAVTLCEEEISDVSLSTFYAFDHESGGARRPGLQLTQRTRSGRPRQGSGGCADDCAGGGPTCCATCATGPGCAQ